MLDSAVTFNTGFRDDLEFWTGLDSVFRLLVEDLSTELISHVCGMDVLTLLVCVRIVALVELVAAG